MIKLGVILAGLLVFALYGFARAQSGLDSASVATALGDLLGSEDFCNLHFDQDAIRKFIDTKVTKDDMQFSATLRMMTDGVRFQNNEMSASEKTAHCTQIERVARSFGFIK